MNLNIKINFRQLTSSLIPFFFYPSPKKNEEFSYDDLIASFRMYGETRFFRLFRRLFLSPLCVKEALFSITSFTSLSQPIALVYHEILFPVLLYF